MLSSILTRLAAGMLFAAAVTAKPASADTPPAAQSREAEAEARFRAGSDAFDQGKIDEACTAFAQSLRLYPTLGTLLNLALCYEKQGKTASAWRAFTHASAWASDAGQRDRREFAQKHVAALERALSRVRIDVEDTAPVALAVDGEPIAEATTLPIFLNPGEHTFEASAQGRVPYSTKATVPAGPGAAVVVVTVPALKPEVVEAPTATTATVLSTTPPSRRRTAGWIVGATGLAAVGFGAYFGIHAVSETSSIPASCGTHCDTGGAQVSEVASLVALGVGAAGLAVGGWLLFANPDGAPQAALRVVPRISAQGGGLDLIRAW